MNILNRNSLFYFLLTGILFLNFPFALKAQGNDSLSEKSEAGEYALVVYAGGGWSAYASTPGVPDFIESETTKGGISGSLRVMWHPDHLLRLGLETGMVPFYSYTIKDNNYTGEMHLSAIPIMLEWSMPVAKKFNVFLGYGIFILNSKLDYAGVTNSSTNSLGFTLAANYIHPLSDNLGIAGEVKWMNATETKNKVFNVQVQLVWKFYKW